MNRRGFSLIEIVITLGIAVIIITTMAVAINSVLSTSRFRSGQAQQVDRATRTLDYVVQTIRESQPSSTGGYPIITAEDNSLTIYTTLAGSAISQVRFFISGTSLQQGIIRPVGSPATYPSANEEISTILPNIETGGQPLFKYFDKTYTGSQNSLSSPYDTASIRLVQMTLKFDPSISSAPGLMTISLNAQLRNLKDNY